MDPVLILLIFGLYISLSNNLRHFNYVNLKMDWTNAQNYCRVHYTDLATIQNAKQLTRLGARRPPGFRGAWIGLKDDPASWKTVTRNDPNSWKWSATGEKSKTGFQQWDINQPNNYGGAYCVIMNGFGNWMDLNCWHLRYFVCQTVKSETEKSFHMISLLKSWHKAQEFCRQHHSDLATIENSAENERIHSQKIFLETWIGLYRESFHWSDNSDSPFRYWNPGEPNNFWPSEYCVLEETNQKWNDVNCNNEVAVICHEDDILYTTVVKVTFRMLTNLADPGVYDQIVQRLTALTGSLGPYNVTLQWKVEPEIEKQSKVKAFDSI